MITISETLRSIRFTRAVVVTLPPSLRVSTTSASMPGEALDYTVTIPIDHLRGLALLLVNFSRRL